MCPQAASTLPIPDVLCHPRAAPWGSATHCRTPGGPPRPPSLLWALRHPQIPAAAWTRQLLVVHPNATQPRAHHGAIRCHLLQASTKGANILLASRSLGAFPPPQLLTASLTEGVCRWPCVLQTQEPSLLPAGTEQGKAVSTVKRLRSSCTKPSARCGKGVTQHSVPKRKNTHTKKKSSSS